MRPPKDENSNFDHITFETPSSSTHVDVQEILRDMRAGMRTKGFLYKYSFTLPEFEEILKTMIRQRLLTVDEFKEWKTKRPVQAPAPSASETTPPPPRPPERTVQQPPAAQNVETYVITDPENNAWVLQLFSTQRDRIRGAKFKVNLHGKKYFFVVEDLLFRGLVQMLAGTAGAKVGKTKREEAVEFINRHGWSAYLERRAVEANVAEEDQQPSAGRARLVLLHCRNDTFLAALHTPAPAINLYVGNSLEKIRLRLSKSVDTSSLDV